MPRLLLECLSLPRPLRCVVSSLAVHHLSGPEKLRLFVDLADRLDPGGALLLADLVEAAPPRVAALFARSGRRRSASAVFAASATSGRSTPFALANGIFAGKICPTPSTNRRDSSISWIGCGLPDSAR